MTSPKSPAALLLGLVNQWRESATHIRDACLFDEANVLTKCADDLESAIAAASLEGQAEDAARYRWLRDGHIYGPVAVLSAHQNHKLLEGPFLDAALDIARTAKENES